MILSLLLIISFLLFSFLVTKKNRKNLKNSILISLVFVFSPVILFHQLNLSIFIFLESLLVLFLVKDFLKNTLLKKLLFLIIIIYLSISSLYLINIIDLKFQIDPLRLFFIDNSSIETVKRFQINALYIPNILRVFFYNYLQIGFNFLVRILDYLWIDNIISFLGFSFIYLLYLNFKKINFELLVPTFIIFLINSLHRNPNTSFLFLTLIPFFLYFFIRNNKKVNTLFLFFLIIFSALYSFL